MGQSLLDNTYVSTIGAFRVIQLSSLRVCSLAAERGVW